MQQIQKTKNKIPAIYRRETAEQKNKCTIQNQKTTTNKQHKKHTTILRIQKNNRNE